MKILVIRFSSLGDLVTLEPVMRSIRFFFKDAEISFLTSKIGSEIYAAGDYFDSILVHRDIIASYKNLKHAKFDYILNLQCTRVTHLLTFLLKKKKLINKARGFWKKTFNIPEQSKDHKALLNEFEIPAGTIESYLLERPNLAIRFHPKPCLDTEVLNASSPLVAISIGASPRWQTKKWGTDNYKNLVKELINRGCAVILVGGADEGLESKKIEDECPEVMNRVGKTSISELMSLLGCVDLYVGNDSGPSHIAAAVGVRTITIFGPTSVKHCAKNENYNGEHYCVAPHHVDCHPCYLTNCPIGLKCMLSIKVNEILAVVSRLISSDK